MKTKTITTIPNSTRTSITIFTSSYEWKQKLLLLFLTQLGQPSLSSLRLINETKTITTFPTMYKSNHHFYDSTSTSKGEKTSILIESWIIQMILSYFRSSSRQWSLRLYSKSKGTTHEKFSILIENSMIFRINTKKNWVDWSDFHTLLWTVLFFEK